MSECSSRNSLDHHPQGPVGRIDAWLCRCQTLAGCSRVVRVVCTASLLEPLPVGLIDSWALGAFFPPLPFCFWSQHAFPSFWSFAGTTEQLHSKALSVSVLSILQCGCLAFSFSALPTEVSVPSLYDSPATRTKLHNLGVRVFLPADDSSSKTMHCRAERG